MFQSVTCHIELSDPEALKCNANYWSHRKGPLNGRFFRPQSYPAWGNLDTNKVRFKGRPSSSQAMLSCLPRPYFNISSIVLFVHSLCAL